jgi:hypothetical protein
MAVLPDFGQHLGFGGKAIESHSTGRLDRETGERSDADAEGGSMKREASMRVPPSPGLSSKAGSVTDCP